MTPEAALAAHSASMTEYEQNEIRDYPEVYFTGPLADKVPASLLHDESNHGFDDERGDYAIVPHDHLAYRYEVLEQIGKGSFGKVVRACDCREQRTVAVKVIRNKTRFHKQALVEVKVLQHLRDHDPHGDHAPRSSSDGPL